MSDKTVKLTRNELYEKVWNESLFKLAKKLGISDRGLAKICKRYQIPIPGIGYWSKLRAGSKVEQKPLLTFNTNRNINDDDIEICVHPKIYNVNREYSISDTTQRAIYFELEEKNKIIVNTGNNLRHKVTLQLKKMLSSQSEKGIVKAKHGCLKAMVVSIESVSRALHILDALFLSLELRSHTVFMKKDPCCRVFIKIFGEEFEIRITERIRHIRKTNEEIEKSWHKFNYIPSQELRLEFNGEHTQKIIDERKKICFEKELNSILIELYDTAEHNKFRGEQFAEYRRKQKEEELLRLERQHIEGIYKKRLQLILTESQKWSQANQLQQFICVLESELTKYRLTEEQTANINFVIAWSKKHIEKSNPFQLTMNILYNFIRETTY